MVNLVAGVPERDSSLPGSPSNAERCRLAAKAVSRGPMGEGQRRAMGQILSAIEKKEGEIRERASIISQIGAAEYDVKKELPNFCVALYAIRMLRETGLASRADGGESGFMIFEKMAGEILKSLNGGFFNLDAGGLAARFAEMRTWFDACSMEFGTRSLSFEQVLHDYAPLTELFFEERKRT